MTTQTEATEIVEQTLADIRSRSVVDNRYKLRYAERALSARGKKGVDKRVVAQSNGDWLALELALRVRPTKKHKLNVPALEAILDANGVEHQHWPRNTPNWQGRLRMTSGLALRAVVAANGVLVIPGEGELPAPRAWCDRWVK